MTFSFFLIVVAALFLAPYFSVVLCGLLVHHGIWSIQWSVPTILVVVTLRYRLIECRGGKKRRLSALGFRFVRALGLLLLGLYAAHLFHHVLGAFSRYFLGALVLVLALLWLSHADRYLPDQLARLPEKIPRPAKFPVGSRRVAAALVLMPFWRPAPVGLEPTLRLAVEAAGLSYVEGSVQSGESIAPGFRAVVGAQRVLLLASEPEASPDVYLARFMFDHEGRPTRVTGLFNLSETASAAESGLVRDGWWAAWRVEVGGELRSIEVADLRGERVPSGPGWGPVGRGQRRVTNIQQTGQARGIGRASITLETPKKVNAVLRSGTLVLEGGGAPVTWELGRPPSPEFTERGFELIERPPPRSGDVTTWAVDRTREVVGSEWMQWIKGVAFWASAQVEDLHADVVGVDAAENIAEELGDVVEQLPIVTESPIPNWPPEPIAPLLHPPLPAEGKWVDLGRDPITGNPHSEEADFLLTFIRVDPKRSYNQVSITLWDPRRVELHIVAGTEEPKSTLGTTGTGLIARDPDVLERLAGAFNGAFQAVHGEFGMMEGKVVQLPPKPFAATIVTYEDGSVGLGTWPAAPTPIEPDLVGLRQNMTPLVAEGRINPYGRHWWGGVPEGWTEEARTVRSGLCMTRERYLAYFYSPSVDPDRLAQAMVAARCHYGIHLDMNAGHAGFEFYRVAPTDDLPTLGRELDPAWEAKGAVPGVQGQSFLARLMVRKMPLMNFPRYIHRTPRDFFYLLRRWTLPDRGLSLPDAAEVPFGVVDVADNHFPPFVVAAQVKVPEMKSGTVRVTRFDGKELAVSGAPQGQVLSIEQRAEEEPDAAQLALFHSSAGFSIRDRHEKVEGETLLLMESGGDATYCVDDRGFLSVVEPSRDVSAEQLEEVVKALHCKALIRAERGALRLVGAEAADKMPAPAAADERASTSVPLFRRSQPWARELYPSTPIVPQSVWGIPQARRVEVAPR